MPAREPLEMQMAALGLELVGYCERLSQYSELMRSPLLSDFTAAEADILGKSMLMVRAGPGQQLIVEGDPGDWMMLLVSGTVDIGKRKIGAEPDSDITGASARLGVVRAGAVLGEMSMFDGEPRYASCWALSEVEAAVLGRESVGGLIARHPALGAKLLVKLTQVLAQRLRTTSNMLVRALRMQAAPRP